MPFADSLWQKVHITLNAQNYKERVEGEAGSILILKSQLVFKLKFFLTFGVQTALGVQSICSRVLYLLLCIIFLLSDPSPQLIVTVKIPVCFELPF